MGDRKSPLLWATRAWEVGEANNLRILRGFWVEEIHSIFGKPDAGLSPLPPNPSLFGLVFMASGYLGPFCGGGICLFFLVPGTYIHT